MQNEIKTNSEIDLFALSKLIWKNKTKIAKWAALGLVFGAIIAWSIPKEYTSLTKLAPEGNKAANGSIGALASMMGANPSSSVDAINDKLYPEIIASTPFILEFANLQVEVENKKMTLSEYMLKNQKYTWWSYIFGFPNQAIGWIANIGKAKVDTLNIQNSPAIQYSFANRIKKAVVLEVDAKMGFMTITSTFQNPIIAKLVADSIITKLQKYVTHYRTAKTKANLESVKKMLEQAQNLFYEADHKYAQTVDKNLNMATKSASIKIDRLLDERNLAYQVYQQLAIQVETEIIKLQEEKIIVAVIEPPTTPVSPSAPRKVMITCAFAFLAACAMTFKIVIKYLLNK